MRLGTAVWREGSQERRALVALLPSDPGRVVDLNRLERQRLAKLGEGHADALADALVPADLGRLLEGGPRALHRARQVLAYGEKWERRSGLPASLAPRLKEVRMLACLPCPNRLRRWDGGLLDSRTVQGPGAVLTQLPAPTLAMLGLHGGQPAGCCLAVADAGGVVLGAWLELDVDWAGELALTLGTQRRSLPMDAFCGLVLPCLAAAEVLLAPAAELWPTHAPSGMVDLQVSSPFDTLALRLEEALAHPTLQ